MATSTAAAATGLTSTTAPGKLFESRSELADHYKSDWHKYNLKRREAGLPLLEEPDFKVRLEAALALRRERETKNERSGTDHLSKNSKKKNKKTSKKNGGVVFGNEGGGAVGMSPVKAYEQMKQQKAAGAKQEQADNEGEAAEPAPTEEDSEMKEAEEVEEEEAPVIEPRQCLFDSHMCPTIPHNIKRMQEKYGFFIPDQEYLIDTEGLLGYCHEKIKLGHCCLYCQKFFSSWQGCQKHMISTNHTKLKYERGVDLDEFDPFYDFSEADAEFTGRASAATAKEGQEGGIHQISEDDGDEDGWEDVTDDEAEPVDEEMDDGDDDDDGLYAGYQDEIKEFGFDVTPLGELVFPDGRIIGHRGLARYYKQRIATTESSTAIVAARQAAGERLFRGRVYNVGGVGAEQQKESALALMRAGIDPTAAKGRAGNGILVSSGGGGYSAVSLYRYRAVVKKARRDNARGQRLQQRSNMNMNRMDKKANRLFNGVSVAHAPR